MMEAHDRLYVEKAAVRAHDPDPDARASEQPSSICRRIERKRSISRAARQPRRSSQTWNFAAYIEEFREGKTHSRRADIAAELEEAAVPATADA